jgi:hypothetical protein
MKLERILGAVLGLYTACTPVEEKVDAGVTETPSSFDGGVDSPRPDICTMEGETLFYDDFTGQDLDPQLWDLSSSPCGEGAGYGLIDGNLEMTANSEGTCLLQSNYEVTIGRTRLIYETRWKVREREGTDVFTRLIRHNESENTANGISLTLDEGKLSYHLGGTNCGYVSGELNPGDVTKNHTFRFIAQEGNHTYFCVDGQYKDGIGSNCLPSNIPLNIRLTCQSADNNEKRCLFDYVRIEKVN